MNQSGALYRDLRNKTVVVTGGGSGLGFAIASEFIANSSHVVIVGRDAARLKEARKLLGKKAHCIAFDVDEIDRLPELVALIKGAVGEVDVLVNNAGINMKKDVLHVTNKDFQGIIQTNQTAVFALTRDILRSMVVRRSGSVIMISSMASRYGIPKVIGYTASKSAVEGMTRALAVECAPFGIRVNCIAPGFIKTRMSSEALESDPERKHKVLARTPMGRLGEPADVAHAALFLASEQSKFVTGVVLPVDGGNSIGF
ncbi:MAG: SDR family NAD(P)-dependent oxidoreductase [Ignavibacteriales bacterium]|nr:SDR family NAD(P)-dependent oxidoreductase [Ignavibacteriales bacterium]